MESLPASYELVDVHCVFRDGCPIAAAIVVRDPQGRYHTVNVPSLTTLGAVLAAALPAPTEAQVDQQRAAQRDFQMNCYIGIGEQTRVGDPAAATFIVPCTRYVLRTDKDVENRHDTAEQDVARRIREEMDAQELAVLLGAHPTEQETVQRLDRLVAEHEQARRDTAARVKREVEHERTAQAERQALGRKKEERAAALRTALDQAQVHLDYTAPAEPPPSVLLWERDYIRAFSDYRRGGVPPHHRPSDTPFRLVNLPPQAETVAAGEGADITINLNDYPSTSWEESAQATPLADLVRLQDSLRAQESPLGGIHYIQQTIAQDMLSGTLAVGEGRHQSRAAAEVHSQMLDAALYGSTRVPHGHIEPSHAAPQELAYVADRIHETIAVPDPWDALGLVLRQDAGDWFLDVPGFEGCEVQIFGPYTQPPTLVGDRVVAGCCYVEIRDQHGPIYLCRAEGTYREVDKETYEHPPES